MELNNLPLQGCGYGLSSQGNMEGCVLTKGPAPIHFKTKPVSLPSIQEMSTEIYYV